MTALFRNTNVPVWEYESSPVDEVWQNDYYIVAVHRNVPVADGWPPMIWLSIKPRSQNLRKPSWRALQRIKNELVGPQHEAVEIYPAESRLIDTCDKYHLWVFCDPTLRFPFGFNEGRKDTNEHAASHSGWLQQRSNKGMAC